MKREYPVYSGNDLGVTYTKEASRFRLWAPTADWVKIRFYSDGHTDSFLEAFPMVKDCDGTWVFEYAGDRKGLYYTYQVVSDGKILEETIDPYAKACGVNGRRGMIVDLPDTDPEDFDYDYGPLVRNQADIIVTEISVADATGDRSSCAKHKGKFLGLAEEGLRTKAGYPTGVDYFANLGVTHVQIMPFYDFATVDETGLLGKNYNWGYDPLNYNIPEGSYSTNPYDGAVRIRECKQMIQAFHRKGIGVIMDVVYNHTYKTRGACFQETVPDYYYRLWEGQLSNGSGCGNEIASEKPMVRKYIIDSLVYWMAEYHVDGFRFDLMGILDVETMNAAARELRRINPGVILYGEGWAGGLCAYPEEKRAVKSQVGKLDGIGIFSDEIRDTIKGGVFHYADPGFVNGGWKKKADICFGLAGGMKHPQVQQLFTGRYKEFWAERADQVVNYISCHDNLTLWDKLHFTNPNASTPMKLAMNKLAAAIIFTAQGITLFQAGEEFGRSKPFRKKEKYSGNSYNLPLSVNSMKYRQLEDFADLYEYYRGLIAFRKSHVSFRLHVQERIEECIYYIQELPEQVVGFVITVPGKEKLLIIFNANDQPVTVDLLPGEVWGVQVDHQTAGVEILRSFCNKAVVEAKSCLAAMRL